jgi:hypothetical protein
VKRLDLVRRRHDTAQVEVSAADELLVGADVRRRDAQHPQLVEDVRIDVVGRRRVRPDKARLRLQVRQPHRLQFFEIADEDGHLAGLPELDQAGRRHLGDGGITGREDGQSGDVTDAAVAEVP